MLQLASRQLILDGLPCLGALAWVPSLATHHLRGCLPAPMGCAWLQVMTLFMDAAARADNPQLILQVLARMARIGMLPSPQVG